MHFCCTPIFVRNWQGTYPSSVCLRDRVSGVRCVVWCCCTVLTLLLLYSFDVVDVQLWRCCSTVFTLLLYSFVGVVQLRIVSVVRFWWCYSIFSTLFFTVLFLYSFYVVFCTYSFDVVIEFNTVVVRFWWCYFIFSTLILTVLVYSFELLLYNFACVAIQFFDVVVVVQLLRCFPISLNVLSYSCDGVVVQFDVIIVQCCRCCSTISGSFFNVGLLYSFDVVVL